MNYDGKKDLEHGDVDPQGIDVETVSPLRR
jgi:hypothetical protein